MAKGEKEYHESYGMLKIGRVSHGQETILFGSSIPHRETIRLSIQAGSLQRDLHHDWYLAEGREYIEIEMSQAQFAEAITSFNQGSGVPVTIRCLNGKNIEEPQFSNKRIQYEEEFKHKMKSLEQKLSVLTEGAEDVLKNKKSITKGDRENILYQLSMLKQELASNIPFMMNSYNEQLDKTTKEAKAELEAYTINKLNQLGLSKLEELQGISTNPFQQIQLIEESK